MSLQVLEYGEVQVLFQALFLGFGVWGLGSCGVGSGQKVLLLKKMFVDGCGEWRVPADLCLLWHFMF